MKKIILFVFITSLFACNSPYSMDKFKEVLNIAKFQAPVSHYDPLYSAKYGEFKNFCNKYFNLQDNKYMSFFMCDKKHRSELRFKKDWKVSSKSAKILEAEVKLFPLNEKREFTFLQIHADDTLQNEPVINKPLLRIVWYKELHDKFNHIWAVIRTCDDPYIMCYEKDNLGKMPNRFFDVKIKVQNSTLKIWVNNKLKVNKNVSYWNQFENYFKAGVYLQDYGCAKALFNLIKVKE